MRAALSGLLASLRQLRLAEAGTAAVEFALVLPIMLVLYIGSVEVSLLISLDRKVQSAAGALGDLVARSDTTLPAATLQDYFKAAAGIMTPHPADELEQIVTQVYVDADGAATVVWSREYHDGTMSVGTKYQPGDDFSLPAAMTDIASESNVIVAEASYDYPPIYGFAFNQTINLYRENFFMPRFGGSITLN